MISSSFTHRNHFIEIMIYKKWKFKRSFLGHTLQSLYSTSTGSKIRLKYRENLTNKRISFHLNIQTHRITNPTLFPKNVIISERFCNCSHNCYHFDFTQKVIRTPSRPDFFYEFAIQTIAKQNGKEKFFLNNFTCFRWLILVLYNKCETKRS